MVRLCVLVPTAVPALVAPPWEMVQEPPVFPIIVVSTMLRSPPKLLLVKNRPPPNALAPAALLTILSAHRLTSTEKGEEEQGSEPRRKPHVPSDARTTSSPR